MIGDAGDYDLGPADGDDSLDHANRDVLAIETAPLLDVEFEIAVMRALRSHRLEDTIRSPLILRMASARTIPFQDRDRSAWTSPATTRLPARTLPNATPSSLAQMTISSGWARLDSGGRERLQHTDGGKRAEVSIEVASVRHRVDMRAEQNRRE